MIEHAVAVIVNEGTWLPASMTLAALGAARLILRYRGSTLPIRHRILAAMNLSVGITIGSMACGHLLAVATKLALGTLREGSLVIFVAIGIGLLVPSGMVIRHTRALLAGGGDDRPTTVLLHTWLTVTLLTLGLHNLPLAAPALFTMAYRGYSGGLTGWAIAGVALAFNVALFTASLVFLASGQSFEQFRGME